MATRKKASRSARKPVRRPSPHLTFNHAMVYVADVARAVAFYRDRLGFRVVDEYPGAYARLVAPRGGNSLALHRSEPGMRLDPKVHGIRLYFEVRGLDAFCARLARAGVKFEQEPRDMPWGWRHAYLRDPDGHEISLYWAGRARLRATAMHDDEG